VGLGRQALGREQIDRHGLCPVECLYVGNSIHKNYSQAIVCRMMLNAAEAELAQAFAYLFTTIYPRELAGKRIMTTNLAQCISGAFGSLFAYAVQTMGARNGLAAWRWLFIIEFLITIVICGIGWAFLPKEPRPPGS
jgi:hypothetical protein